MEEIKNEVKETKAPATRINASVKPEDFNWEAFEGGDVYGNADKKSIEEAYTATLSTTQMVRASRERSAQIEQVSASAIIWQIWQ